MNLYPMKLEPILQQRVWGGRRLAEMFAKMLPDEKPYGESWEVSDVSDAASVIANGPLAGRTLRELMTGDGVGVGSKRLLGEARSAEGGRFPLLVKLLDCREKLSVQVHPDLAACRRIGGNARPKTESWIVLHAEPGAKIYLGLKPNVTKEAFAAGIENDTVGDMLNVIEPKVGDCLYIASGTVHALGGGLVIAEIQQTSDTTYRVYDWGRVGLDGRPRALHVERALESIHFDATEPPKPIEPTETANGKVVLREAFATIFRDEIDAEYDFKVSDHVAVSLCVAGAGVLEGNGESVAIRAGDAVLLPADLGKVTVTPEPGERLVMIRAIPN